MTPKHEAADDDHRVCGMTAVYQTPWGKILCRGHGNLVMSNHGQDAVQDLPVDYIGSCSWDLTE